MCEFRARQPTWPCNAWKTPLTPEPLRSIGAEAVRRADANDGRRGLLLRTLDGLGIGFDS